VISAGNAFSYSSNDHKRLDIGMLIPAAINTKGKHDNVFVVTACGRDKIPLKNVNFEHDVVDACVASTDEKIVSSEATTMFSNVLARIIEDNGYINPSKMRAHLAYQVKGVYEQSSSVGYRYYVDHSLFRKSEQIVIYDEVCEENSYYSNMIQKKYYPK